MFFGNPYFGNPYFGGPYFGGFVIVEPSDPFLGIGFDFTIPASFLAYEVPPSFLQFDIPPS